MKEAIRGLTSAEVERSKEKYGDNRLKRIKGKSFFKRFFENLSDPIIRILLMALVLEVVVTLGNCNYFEIFGIVIAILISTTVSTVSEHRSEQAFEKLNDEQSILVSVLRDNKIEKIDSSEVVVGDIVYLSSGDKICADGVIISGRIAVDQSALNGESIECKKMPGNDSGWDLSCENHVFRGSVITGGNGIMKVGRVGEATYYGMVAKDVQSETRESPLKLRLGKLAGQISRIGYIVALLVGICYLFSSIVMDNGYSWEKIIDYIKNVPKISSTLIHALTLMITVVVVAAPEGLPMMITVVLSANMKKMLSENILVKKLVGIETAGSLNILFTDKTGTLTHGKMKLDRIITVDGVYKSSVSLEKTGKLYNHLLLSARYNTDVCGNVKSSSTGNATDKAIYSFFEDSDIVFASVKEKTSFNSENKFSSVTLDNGITYIKGAPEVVLNGCKRGIDSKGEIADIDFALVESEKRSAAALGERIIAIAMKIGNSHEPIFLGLAILKDKIRKGVKEAVKEVTRAGIQVVMVTGDGKETAISIAEECGVMNRGAGHIALTSGELMKMSDDEVKNILPKLRVLARALPQDKTRLVRLAQELELVAGMTGDGINDAPSLKLADVGFGMGSGTDIAKSAADVVILDDSFSAISKTVLYGRTIFKSIRKFITFQLIMNLTACGVSLVGQFIGIDTPITIIQMLWINIIMDTLGGLAFAGEAPLEYYMLEPPKRRDEPILSGEMLKRIFVQGAFSLGICIFFLTSPVFKSFYNYYSSSDAFFTAFYALFVFIGLSNCLGARSERLWLFSNISKNRLFIIILFFISVIQIFMIYQGGVLFRCVPLTLGELWFALSLSLSVLPFDVVRRIVEKLK